MGESGRRFFFKEGSGVTRVPGTYVLNLKEAFLKWANVYALIVYIDEGNMDETKDEKIEKLVNQKYFSLIHKIQLMIH